MCQKGTLSQPLRLKLWKLPDQLSGCPASKRQVFSKFENTNNWQNCIHTTDRRGEGRGTLFSKGLDLLAVYLALSFSSASLCQVEKGNHNLYTWFPEGRRPNHRCSVALGTIRESDSGKTKCNSDPNDTIIYSLWWSLNVCFTKKTPSFPWYLDIKRVLRRIFFRKLLYFFFFI